MQEESKQLYKAVSIIVNRLKEQYNIKYTNFCYENDIPMATYDAIINASRQSSFFNIAKVVKALGLNFEEFGALLDKELPENFLKEDE